MLSVIVPAHNEEKYIGRCLDALARQRTSRPFEVIVVDNVCVDGTANVAAQFGNRLMLRIIKEPKMLRGAARRAGFADAKGNILFSCDADAVPPPLWLETLAAALEEHQDAVAVRCSPIIDDCDPWTNGIHNFIQPMLSKMYRISMGNAQLAGFSFAVWRWAYEAAGGFDASVDAYEDVELGKRLAKIGPILLLPVRVPVSGRRYRKGLLHGTYEYQKAYLERFWLRKHKVDLSNVR